MSAAFTSADFSFFQQGMGPKATPGTPGVAADPGTPGGGPPAAAPASGSGAPGLSGMAPLLLPILVLVPIMLHSSRRQKKEAESRAKLKKGDKVVTQAGLIGELVEMDDR